MKEINSKHFKILSIDNLTDDQLVEFVKTKLKSKVTHIQRNPDENSIRLSILDKNKNTIWILVSGKTEHYNIKFIEPDDLKQNENTNRDLRRKWLFYMTQIFGETYIKNVYAYLNSVLEKSIQSSPNS